MNELRRFSPNGFVLFLCYGIFHRSFHVSCCHDCLHTVSLPIFRKCAVIFKKNVFFSMPVVLPLFSQTKSTSGISAKKMNLRGQVQYFFGFSHTGYICGKKACVTLLSDIFFKNLHTAHQSHLLSIPLPNINEHREDTAEIILRRTPSMVFTKQPPTGYICNKNPS